MTEEQVVQLIVREVLSRLREEGQSGLQPDAPVAKAAQSGFQPDAPAERAQTDRRLVPISVSARHLHLSQEHVAALFGPEHSLTKLKDLMQPGQFAANETVAVHGPKGSFPRVRVLGPARGETQLEVSLTDARFLGLAVPIRLSGSIDSTPGITLEGPKGRVVIPRGVIVAARHIHLGTGDAKRFGLTDGQRVRIRTTGERPLTFDDVLVRVSEQFVAEVHVDTDEGNAGATRDGQLAEIVD